MVTGVIYLYESPSGKYYVGQTARESQRRSLFLNEHQAYTRWSSAIDRARKKYGPANFKYSIVCRVSASTESDLKRLLDLAERWYIQKFDSYDRGYNSNLGGGSNLGFRHSDVTKCKMRGRIVSEETRLLRARPVCCWDSSFVFVTEFPGVAWAERELHLRVGSCSNISIVCSRGGGLVQGYYFCHPEDRQSFESRFASWSKKSWSTSKRLVRYEAIDGSLSGEGYACDLSSLLGIPTAHIVRVYRGKRKSAGGYRFTYVDDQTYVSISELPDDYFVKGASRRYRVICTRLSDGFTCIYSSRKEAAVTTGVSLYSVTVCCREHRDGVSGYCFRYVNDVVSGG
nr:MAG TPA: intron associated endonuclease [Caudoviricetes sp.]